MSGCRSCGNKGGYKPSCSIFKDNGDGTWTHTSECGVESTITVGAKSIFTDNGDGTFTHDDGTGLKVTFRIPPASSLVRNPNGTITHVSGNGVSTTFSEGSISSLTNNGDGTYTHNDGHGNITVITTGAASTSSLTDNGDGSFTFVGTDGNPVVIPKTPVTTMVDNGDGTYTYTDEDGVSTTIGAIGETTTTLVNNGGGVYTYTNEEGVSSVITVPAETITSLVDNGDNTFTYTSENGTVTTIAVGAGGTPETLTTLVDNGDNTYTYTSEDGTTTVISDVNTTLTLSPTGTLTYTSEDGTVSNIDLCPAVKACETDTSLTYNTGTNTLTYTGEDGTPVDIVLNMGGSTSSITNTNPGNPIATHNDGGGTNVVINETITAIAYDTATGVITYTPEDGVDVVMTLNKENVTVSAVAGESPIATPPANPLEGDEYVNTTDGRSWIYDGAAWVERVTCACPQVQIEKLVLNPGPYNTGEDVNYIFVVTNTGSIPLTNVVVTDPDATVTGGPLATLAVGASDSTTFTGVHTITAAEAGAGFYVNTASVTADSTKGSVAGSGSAAVTTRNTVRFYRDGDATEAAIPTELDTAIANGAPIAITDGAGNFTTVEPDLTFAELQAYAEGIYGVGTVVDPVTYDITPANGSTTNTPLCVDSEVRCGVRFFTPAQLPPEVTRPNFTTTNAGRNWVWTYPDGTVYTLDIVAPAAFIEANIDPSEARLENSNPNGGANTVVNVSWSIDATNIVDASPTGCQHSVSGQVVVNDIDNGSQMSNIVGGNTNGVFGNFVEAPAGTYTADPGQNSDMGNFGRWFDGSLTGVQTFSFDMNITPEDIVSLTPSHRPKVWIEATYLCGTFVSAVDANGVARTEAEIDFS